MGVIKRGILGGFQGKVANVVGSSWKGIDVMKSLPLSVANPNTAAQQTQRGKFASVVDFAKMILVSIIKPLWDRFAQGQSGYNAFVSTNIDYFNSDGLNVPADLVISRGALTGAVGLSFAPADGETQALVNWINNSGSGSAVASDLAYVLVYNQATKAIGVISGSVARSVGSVLVTMSGEFTSGDVVSAYVAFRRADGTLVSNTAYIESTVV